MTTSNPEEFWLPSLRPVRTPWRARLGLDAIPCVEFDRHKTHILLPLHPANAQDEGVLRPLLALLLPHM